MPFNARGHARIHAAFTTRIKREAQRPAGRPDGEKVLCAFLSVCGFRSPKIFLGFKIFFGVPPPVTPSLTGTYEIYFKGGVTTHLKDYRKYPGNEIRRWSFMFNTEDWDDLELAEELGNLIEDHQMEQGFN